MKKYYVLTASLLILMPMWNVSASPGETDEYCKRAGDQKESLVEVLSKDVAYYDDISPEKYLHEGKDIYRLAIINITRYFEGDHLKIATAEYAGYQEDLLSEYCYQNREISRIRQKYISYFDSKDSKAFDKSKKNETLFSLYFHDGKLVHLVENGEPVERNDLRFIMKSVSGINDSNLILSIER